MSENKWICYAVPIGILVPIMVFDIVGLTETTAKEIKDECPRSYLWVYVLTSLIFLGINSITNLMCSSNDSENSFSSNIFVNIGLFIWGCIELFDVECVGEFDDTVLYKMSIFHFSTQTFMTFVIFILVMAKICKMC